MRTRDLTELLLLSALWGASFILMRVAVPVFGPIALIALRVSVAVVFLLPLLLARGAPSPRAHDAGTGAAHAALAALFTRPWEMLGLGVVNSALPFALLAYATVSITAGFAAVLNATTPIWAAVVGALWLGQRSGPRQWLGLSLGVVGVAVLVWGRIDLRPGATGWAILAGLLAPVSYGVAATYSRRFMIDRAPLVVATGSQIAATLVLLPFLPAGWPVDPPQPGAWAAAAALGVLCTGVAYILYFRLIAHVGAVRAASVTFLVPLFATLWGLLLLGEPVTVPMFVGGSIVLAGTALSLNLIPFGRVAA